MNTEEIIEGNKLIAEFMGFNKKHGALNHYSVPKGTEMEYKAFTLDIKNMPYHSSWDWLMPVVEKIGKIEFHRDQQDMGEGLIETIIHTHYPRTFGMLNHSTGNPMFRYNCGILFESEKLIEAAWMATVEFINNQQTPKP